MQKQKKKRKPSAQMSLFDVWKSVGLRRCNELVHRVIANHDSETGKAFDKSHSQELTVECGMTLPKKSGKKGLGPNVQKRKEIVLHDPAKETEAKFLLRMEADAMADRENCSNNSSNPSRKRRRHDEDANDNDSSVERNTTRSTRHHALAGL